MALSYVQGAGADAESADSIAVDFPGSVTSGNNICAAGAADATTCAAGAVTDDGSNTYTREAVTANYNGTGGTAAIYRSFNVSGGSSFTVTFDADASTGSDYHALGIAEFTGTSVAVTGTVAQEVGDSDTPVSDSIVTDANAIIFGFVAKYGIGTTTPGADYTQIAEQEAFTNIPFSWVRRTTVPVAAGTYTVDWVFEENKPYGLVAIAFKEGSGVTYEQEGYRWRNDDGSETAATWKASQDTTSSSGVSTNVRLRMLINRTG